MCSPRWPSPRHSSPAGTTGRRSTTSARRHGVEHALVPPTGYDHTLLDVVGLQRSAVACATWCSSPSWSGRPGGPVGLIRTLSPEGRGQRRRLRQLSGDLPPRCCARVPCRGGQLRPPPRTGLEADGPTRRACAVAFEGRRCRGRGHRCAGSPGGPGRRSPARSRRRPAELGLPADRFVLAVFGGSLGSQRLNEIVVADGRAPGRSMRSGRLPRRRRAQSGDAAPAREAATASCIECLATRTECRWSMPRPI